MPLPRIAIVGRPNVGKSSLMNMIAGSKVSIVDPTPGVTRDRVSAIVDLEAPYRNAARKPVEFTDTGGFGAYYQEGARYDEIGNDLRRLTKDIEQQIAHAVAGADLILFCIDAQAGITPADEHIAKLLREQKLGDRHRTDGTLIPVQVVATKVDGPRWENYAHEFSALGFGLPLMCSSMNNYMRRDLLDGIWERIPEHKDPEAEKRTAQHADLKIAIIGKRNAGKSTLVNTIAGEERMIVSEIPGTTRDAVDVRVEKNGKTLVLVDTAGLRRKKSFQDQVEWYAFDRLQKAVDRADVVILLIDATTKISQVDEQVAMIAQKAFKPVIMAINKWDLAEGQPGRTGRPVTVDDYEKYVRREMRGLDFAPIAFMSGHSGLNVSETVDLAWDLFDQTHERVSTGKLNRLFRKIVELRGPPSKVGKTAKLYYVAQTGTAPPTITLVVNFPELFTSTYQRFLINRLRENSDLAEIPIRLAIRDRKRTLQSERGSSPELADADMQPELAADSYRKDALLGMRGAARKASEKGAAADEAASYFDEPLPEPKTVVTGKGGSRVPRVDDDLDEAALERALAEMEVRALGPELDEQDDHSEINIPVSLRDDDEADESDGDDQPSSQSAGQPSGKSAGRAATKVATKPVTKPATNASAKSAARPSAPNKSSPASSAKSRSSVKPTSRPTPKTSAKPKASAKPARSGKASGKPAAKAAANPPAKPAAKSRPVAPSFAKPTAKSSAQRAGKPTTKSSAKSAAKPAKKARRASRP